MRERRRISLEEATEKLLAAIVPLADPETVPLIDAPGRVAFHDAAATIDLPPFDRSPLDGYAVNHLDLADASADRPARLRVAGCIYAGDVWEGALARGEAVRLMTGSPIPEGATCVVRQEDTDGGGDVVSVFVAHGGHDNYCLRGEDVPCGATLVRRGERMTAGHAGLLAGQGLVDVPVFARPRVGILSTGSELVAGGGRLGPGKIYDSNGVFIAGLCAGAHAVVSRSQRGDDDPDALAAAVAGLLRESDMVVATGGVSVGARDCMPEVGERLGAEMLFHGVDVRPGSPIMALRVGGRILLCLSGNPFAAFVTFHALGAPALRRMGGMERARPDRLTAVLNGAYPKGSNVRRLVPAWLRGGEVSFPSGRQTSRTLLSLAQCNCLVDIPKGTPRLESGDKVEVMPL